MHSCWILTLVSCDMLVTVIMRVLIGSLTSPCAILTTLSPTFSSVDLQYQNFMKENSLLLGWNVFLFLLSSMKHNYWHKRLKNEIRWWWLNLVRTNYVWKSIIIKPYRTTIACSICILKWFKYYYSVYWSFLVTSLCIRPRAQYRP